MSSDVVDRPWSPATMWTARITQGLAVLFLVFDAGIKVLQLPPAIEATTQRGYPASAVLTIGLIQVVCLAAYLVPRTTVLGALLWTGYLGGAIATHLRIQGPLFNQIFPILLAGLIWAPLWLRDARLRALLPLVTTTTKQAAEERSLNSE